MARTNRVEIGALYRVDLSMYCYNDAQKMEYKADPGSYRYYGDILLPVGDYVALLEYQIDEDSRALRKFEQSNSLTATIMHPQLGRLYKDFRTETAFLCCLKICT